MQTGRLLLEAGHINRKLLYWGEIKCTVVLLHYHEHYWSKLVLLQLTVKVSPWPSPLQKVFPSAVISWSLIRSTRCDLTLLQHQMFSRSRECLKDQFLMFSWSSLCIWIYSDRFLAPVSGFHFLYKFALSSTKASGFSSLQFKNRFFYLPFHFVSVLMCGGLQAYNLRGFICLRILCANRTSVKQKYFGPDLWHLKGG